MPTDAVVPLIWATLVLWFAARLTGIVLWLDATVTDIEPAIVV